MQHCMDEWKGREVKVRQKTKLPYFPQQNWGCHMQSHVSCTGWERDTRMNISLISSFNLCETDPLSLLFQISNPVSLPVSSQSCPCFKAGLQSGRSSCVEVTHRAMFTHSYQSQRNPKGSWGEIRGIWPVCSQISERHTLFIMLSQSHDYISSWQMHPFFSLAFHCQQQLLSQHLSRDQRREQHGQQQHTYINNFPVILLKCSGSHTVMHIF